MKVCVRKYQAIAATAVACLNYFLALGTFGQIFACADMWEKCTPSSALTISNKILSFPLGLVAIPGIANYLKIQALFAINAVVWGLLSFGIMRIACRWTRN